ncbi:cytochrome c [Luteimonas sp. TWI165]
MNRTFLLLIPTAACLALAACGGPAADGQAHAGGGTSSSAGLPKGSVQAGERAANVKSAATGQTCTDCHGAGGNAPLDPTYPKIGGQYRDYIAHALQAYRDGTREHALMSQQATGLSDQQIADLAAYFADQPSQLRDLRGVHDR